MASRFKLARAGAAVVGASVMMMMAAAIPAGAEPATGQVGGGDVSGYQVNLGGSHENLRAKLIGFKLSDGTKLKMYCVEIDTRLSDRLMVERPWDDYPNSESPFHEGRENINWALHFGYPVKSADELTAVLTEKGVPLHDGIDEKEAITGTQAAVWHYSDGVKLDKDKPLTGGNKDAAEDVVALYGYLTGEDNVGIGDQPTPALEVSPTELSGAAGERIGPFTVNTNGEISELTSELPEGVKITDVDGAELDASMIKNGAQLYLDVPAEAAEGAGTFELTASASTDTGRLFVGKDYSHKPTQSLIVATAESSEVLAKAGANWTAATPPTSTTQPPTSTVTTPPTTSTTEAAPAPQPKNTSGDLAETGASIFTPILIGVVLVGAGIGALLFQRHRRRA